MSARLRPSVVTAGFTILFAVIANLAWATAITTTGPWYDETVGLVVYSVALLAGTLLAVLVVHQASARMAHLQASLARLDRRIALLRAGGRPVRRPAPRPDADLEDDLDASADGGVRELVRLEKEGHDTLVPVPPGPEDRFGGARTALLRQLTRERIAIREARMEVWSTAAGPVAASLVFLAIAGPMLPGSGGFAAAHYVLNTTLILFLSYGFAPLAAWSVLALGRMSSSDRRAAA